MNRVRALVVDDSPTSRRLLVEILRADAGIEVVGEAGDGLQALLMVKRLCPDIVTMDVQMPILDGFAATKRIMVEAPTPILIITGVDPRSLAVSLEAVRVGALAVQAKPGDPLGPNFEDQARDLVRQVKAMSRVKVVRHYETERRVSLSPVAPRNAADDVAAQVIAIAASTGGPAAIHQILSELPAWFPLPILVVQHISRGFSPGFADWLDKASPLRVKLAAEGEALSGGTAYIAVDERHLGVTAAGRVHLSAAAPVGGFRPSGTVLFESVAAGFGKSAVAVILTGMGRDGVDGLRAVRNAGGRTFAESERSAVVIGMPGAAVTAGLADIVLPIDQIANAMVGLVPVPAADERAVR